MNNNVISIKRTEKFNLIQAKQILPIIRKITEEYRHKVELIMSRLEVTDLENLLLIETLEQEVNELLSAWKSKVSRLGGIPKGLWLVDFDSGDGLYCWRYPEKDILFWHAYSEGVSGRIHVEDKEVVDECFNNHL